MIHDEHSWAEFRCTRRAAIGAALAASGAAGAITQAAPKADAAPAATGRSLVV